MAQIKNISYIGVALVLAAELYIAYRLNLPQGLPRFAAAAVVVLTFVGFYWYTHRKSNG